MTTARARIVLLLNADMLRTPRKHFAMFGQIGWSVVDVTPQRIEVKASYGKDRGIVAEDLAHNLRNAIRSLVGTSLPTERFVMGEVDIPFEEPGSRPSAVITLKSMVDRFGAVSFPRLERLWAQAEREGWTVGADDEDAREARVEAAWDALPPMVTVAPSDHPHDLLLAALNAVTEPRRLRAERVRHNEVKMGVLDVDPDRITLEYFSRWIGGGLWDQGLRGIDAIGSVLHPLISVRGARVVIYDGILEEWSTFDERWEEPRGGTEGCSLATRRRIRELWAACDADGWERGTLARTGPAVVA